MKIPKIALIGLPNVGKSSLFNRLIEQRQALETNIPGTTRDQNHGILLIPPVERKTKKRRGLIKIELIDTPGFKIQNSKFKIQNLANEERLECNIQLQAQRALKEADLILYMIDFTIGDTVDDRKTITKLQRQDKPVILVINKADKPADQIEAAKYIKLGLGEPMPVSAKNGRGASELVERIKNFYPTLVGVKKPRLKPRGSLNLAIVGKPNVGKSSLFNAILQEEKVVVSPVPHTTRDPNNTEITYQNHIINLIDTAGLRKKARIYKSATGRGNKIEIFSIKKTLDIIKKADIALLLIDAFNGITAQDLKISKLINDNNCGLIIIANKWDKIPNKNTRTMQKTREYFYSRLKSLAWAPLIFADVKDPSKGRIFGLEEKYLYMGLGADMKSAHNVQKTNPLYKLLDLSLAINQNQKQELSSEELKLTLQKALKKQPPPRPKRNKPRPKIIDFKQVDTAPPTFLLTLSQRTNLPNHYLGYLKNQLRQRFGLLGTAIKLKISNF